MASVLALSTLPLVPYSDQVKSRVLLNVVVEKDRSHPPIIYSMWLFSPGGILFLDMYRFSCALLSICLVEV